MNKQEKFVRKRGLKGDWAMGLFVVVGMVWEIREMMAKRHDVE